MVFGAILTLNGINDAAGFFHFYYWGFLIPRSCYYNYRLSFNLVVGSRDISSLLLPYSYTNNELRWSNVGWSWSIDARGVRNTYK